MIWKGIVRLLCGVVLAWMFLGSADKRRAANVLSDGRIEFTRNRLAYCAWPVIIVLLSWEFVGELMQCFAKPSHLLNAAILGWFAFWLFTWFPGTIIVSDYGLEEVRWFWKHKRISWKDIVEVNTGNKHRIVTITGEDGAKIVHSGLLVDRPRLLLELKRHCGANLPPDFPTN